MYLSSQEGAVLIMAKVFQVCICVWKSLELCLTYVSVQLGTGSAYSCVLSNQVFAIQFLLKVRLSVCWYCGVYC